ncbi:MAG: PQQ-dependent sugar dehydrogenase [Acidobacteriota bacterium]|nr:PQQ-dependent sugar dehydrogenase [Acidobacteriota bacterium]
MRRFNFLAVSGLCVLFFYSALQAQTAAPTIRLQPYLSGLSSPLLLTNAKDGTKRAFIVQQGGIIKVVQPGSNAPTDFLNISSKISSGGERGLLGLAFHPQFAANGYFFVNYTRAGDGATVIARYKAMNNNAVGDPASERIVLIIAQPFANHNGGMIEFGGDGNLYIGMGDGGSANDPQNNAQNINSLLGKFLRITPSVADISTNPYSVPADNPFVGINGADEIYAVGFRNPFRWSFDRGGTNQLWAGDVGQNAIEEVDIVTKGGNYGWRVYEGTQCTNIDAALCIPTNFVAPVFQYNHTGGRCSVTGGYVYRGRQGTLPNGAYTYGDFCTGEIWMRNGDRQISLLDTTRNISSFGEDEDGEIYVVGIGGTVEKIVRAQANADFDGDLKTDFSVFRPTNSSWYISNSSDNSFRSVQFGLNGDIPTPEDYDGDNITDISVFRPSNGVWYRINSETNTFVSAQFGVNGDIPVAGDYNGDARAELAVFRPLNGVWYVARPTGNPAQNFNAIQFGQNGDKPTVGDFDGDGKYDIAVWRPSNGVWFRLNSTNGVFSAIQFGALGDTPTPGDFDGDGKDDQAVYRSQTGVWYILRSLTGSFQAVQFGINADFPVVGDYDGDGREDIAVFRPQQGIWYILRSSNNGFQAVQFGQNGDLPLPAYDAP